MCCRWQVSTLRWFLNAYNVVFLVSGLVLACLGISELRSLDHSTSIHTAATYILLTVAVLIIVVALVGCLALCRLSRKLLAWYGGFLLAILLLEATCGVLCFFSYDYVRSELRKQFRSLFLEEFGRNYATTYRINMLQRKLKCCGMDGFEDWEHSQWKRDNPKSFVNLVPTSCCKTWSHLCGRWDIPNNIFYDGCTEVIATKIGRNLSYIAGLGAGICFLQLLGITLTFALHAKLKHFQVARCSAYAFQRHKYHNYDYS